MYTMCSGGCVVNGRGLGALGSRDWRCAANAGDKKHMSVETMELRALPRPVYKTKGPGTTERTARTYLPYHTRREIRSQDEPPRVDRAAPASLAARIERLERILHYTHTILPSHVRSRRGGSTGGRRVLRAGGPLLI